MATQIQLRRDTAANWTTANPTLAQGEPGFEIDTGKLKIGTGSTAWNSLAYLEDVQVFAPGSAAAPSISFLGSNAGIYSPGADQVAIATGGTGRLFVDSSGNVGVGSSPTERFQVAVSNNANVAIKLSNSGTSGYLQQNATSGNGAIELGSNGAYPAILSTNGTERLRITSAGLVGVGTSSPSSLLHLVSSGQPTITVADADGRTTQIKSPDSSANPGFIGTTTNHDLLIQAGTTAGGANAMRFNTAGSERMRIDSSGRLGVGTTPAFVLDVKTAGGRAVVTDSGTGMKIAGLTAAGAEAYAGFQGNPVVFLTDGAERARIDSSGRLLVGTSSVPGSVGESGATGSSPQLYLQGTAALTDAPIIGCVSTFSGSYGARLALGHSRSGAILSSGDQLGRIQFAGHDGTDYDSAGAWITAEVDGTPGANDMPGRLVFSTTADGASSPTERMRITNAGDVIINDTSSGGYKFVVRADSSVGTNVLINDTRTGTASSSLMNFTRNAAVVGSISTTNTATSYNTSSDYRLKENIAAVTDGIVRLQQLKPSRFNFIADPSTTVDGFIAHEVQAVVPEAITGEKDAVDDDGNPVYQGIDQSKLVPLLTAALQEAVAKIETLEAKVAALEVQ